MEVLVVCLPLAALLAATRAAPAATRPGAALVGRAAAEVDRSGESGHHHGHQRRKLTHNHLQQLQGILQSSGGDAVHGLDQGLEHVSHSHTGAVHQRAHAGRECLQVVGECLAVDGGLRHAVDGGGGLLELRADALQALGDLGEVVDGGLVDALGVAVDALTNVLQKPAGHRGRRVGVVEEAHHHRHEAHRAAGRGTLSLLLLLLLLLLPLSLCLLAGSCLLGVPLGLLDGALALPVDVLGVDDLELEDGLAAVARLMGHLDGVERRAGRQRAVLTLFVEILEDIAVREVGRLAGLDIGLVEALVAVRQRVDDQLIVLGRRSTAGNVETRQTEPTNVALEVDFEQHGAVGWGDEDILGCGGCRGTLCSSRGGSSGR
mmetsp:Transcript_28314/g.81590  ORF Transcript_28314/g.81590 Transcript_28314/m.81590 type:complete len:376 (-) Transcript_28314:163-1290(-)